jgi:hypothetical protein
MLLHADEMVDETMVAQVKEEENWEKIAKKIIGNIYIYILAQLWKAKGAYFFH